MAEQETGRPEAPDTAPSATPAQDTGREQALQRICQRLGLVDRYADVWGREHVAPEQAVLALLKELGVADASAEALQAQDQRLRDEASRRCLSPVCVLQAGIVGEAVPLQPPAGTEPLRWWVEEEQGLRHEGHWPAPDAGRPRHTAALLLPMALPAGYHRLQVDGGTPDTRASCLLITAPRTCYQPPALQGNGRTWGPALQLYALRSQRNWGMGDFGDLAVAAGQWAARGAGIVGLNPLHALFSHNPPHASPYSPSSRRQLNTLYIDVEAVEDFAACGAARQRVLSAEFQQRLAALRATEQVDYAGVSAAKHEVLRLLWAHFHAEVLPHRGPRALAFEAFRRERGRALRIHATFEALQARFHAADWGVWGWPVWPEDYRDPDGEAVARFTEAHAFEIGYHEYLQWLADGQLARISQRCREQDMAVGLYLDIAVSVDRAGSDTWGDPQLYAAGASVGAPPDEVNPNGQGWGLPPLVPTRLRETRYGVFIDTLRATMRHAGAVRIDHVMGLMRLFWIPPGQPPANGAYVMYPLEEMVAIVALESERNRCLVIGEDMGTVAPAVRQAMASAELLSYRLLYFERDAQGGFLPPQAYPRHALVAVSTHDLATLAGWWSGHDLEVRKALSLFPSPAAYEAQLAGRAQERVRLLLALQHAGLLPPGISPEAACEAPLTPALVEAAHAFLASTPAQVMMVQLEEVLGLPDQANLPGTVDEHPNWRRKLPVSLEQLETEPRLASLTELLARLRPAAAPGELRRSGGAIIPRATYRLQLHRDFGFDAAVRAVPYLARLGISHVYCSPIQRARPGSLHGYDVVGHDEINPELGGREGFERLSAAVQAHGMGLLLDMVPNHMGVFGDDNAWWMDVLENGPCSAYARWFDIDWHPVNTELEGKVLLPVLGEPYGEVLESGQLVLVFDGAAGSFSLRYHEHRFPVDPRSYPLLLERTLESLADVEASADLRLLSTAFGHLPAVSGTEPPGEDLIALRSRDKQLLKRRLARQVAEQPALAEALARTVQQVNESATRDELHALHEAQSFRLAFWRVAADEINYRRFFDINSLAALRIEEPAVFEATQGLALDLAAAGQVDGLRIDHPDGLHDPAQYFQRLQQAHERRAWTAATPGAKVPRKLYVVVEKIAASHEDVPDDWSIHGTTGYRFAMVVGGLFVDTAAEEAFDRCWREFSGEQRSFEALAYEGKREIMQQALASELGVLATALRRIARADRRTRDYSYNALREALAEVAACLPVYRTYLVDQPSEQDRRYIDWAVAQARRRSVGADLSVYDFVRACLLNQTSAPAGSPQAARVRDFAVRFQQFSSPVAAKGVEDTAFYRYSRLVSLNEVGGDPAAFGITVRAFHGASTDRCQRWPHTILATSTHDNKRSEDVRNRLHVLSESPQRWQAALQRWHALARGRAGAAAGEGAAAPSAADEYLLYQTLLGTLPVGGLTDETLPEYRDRIEAYALKAAREAKRHTRWTAPDEAYETALLGFVRSALERVQPNPLLRDLQQEAEVLAWFGALNSLSTVLIKFTSPGVPDLYQGNEMMDLSLVDPDNRRPVDYGLRSRLLDELAPLVAQPGLGGAVGALAATPQDGRAKLWATWRLLALRREHPRLFREGAYKPLRVRGEKCEHLVAYARQVGPEQLVVLAGRLFAQLTGHQAGQLPLGQTHWGDTFVELPELPEGTRLENVLTGESAWVQDGGVTLASAFAQWPAAALLAFPPQ